MRVIILILLSFVAGCSSTRSTLRDISERHDPSGVALEPGYNSYVRRAFLPDHTEYGVIELRDGSYAKYWFRSHHLTDDIGGTWFEMSDGSRIYMRGYFCCEVQLPEAPLTNLDELREFIRKWDGTPT